MKHHITFIKKLVEKGGPDSSEYHELTDWLKLVNSEFSKGILDKKDLVKLRDEMGESLSILTLQGFVFNKPHGYPGDYEIIEKIYQEHVSNNPVVRKWDLYFQLQKAPIAVRNRKQYFINLLSDVDKDLSGNASRVLNIASGPARDLFDFFSKHSNSVVHVDNVEFDPLAISYAKNLCRDFLDNITFLHTNAFDFKSKETYRLIWCAGLFDYLNDKKFMFLLNHIVPLLGDEGEIVIGNFSCDNPTRDYMEIIGDWRLTHRTPDQLISLAKKCNFSDADIRIGNEPEGVNLFLHIKRGKNFISY
ncbi:MAG: hypothetical protein GY699_16565 [Desulfobacteraceae bacterium]|nr:hypothetical protein [Desulfobacteraceae bacterium]